ncbi:MAG TPA: penicillin acylase family protein [Streptosporangiaceae bacterium]|jgi:penicillin amidase|nr:penicillin acylase family protein [Streptosporangiaceae bacterium]
MRNHVRRGPRAVRHAAHLLVAVCVSASVLGVFAFGWGPLPALGEALDPGHGAWASAAGAALPHSESLRIPGLMHPATVYFTAQGIPSVRAADENDLYLAQGYVEASFRLTEMDLQRRLAEGRLAQLGGASEVSSDEFELRLGLLRTAEQEWAQTPRSSAAGQELLAYSRGVNDYLARERATHGWPAIFTLAGVYPGAWTPVDSLAVQGLLTQLLDFTTTPLDYALLERSLGAARTMTWFPVVAPDAQSPYDQGPYRYSGVTPLAAGAASSAGAAMSTAAAAGQNGPSAALDAAHGGVPAKAAAAARSLLGQIGQLPAGQVHEYPDSNAWAANGPAVSGGGAMLAGDPHLPLTLPSIWYQLALGAPGLAVSGVSVPGVPGIVIGHNKNIAWSLTDVQNESTLFYSEQTSASHPGQYYWRGRWRPMRQVHYTIAVRGGAPRHLTVDITVHGPIMTQVRQTTAVDWMGNVPSPDVAVIAQISKASNYAQFHAALARWKAPTQNFVYADQAGNIGVVAAGYFPQVAHGDPWLPLPGTGADDVVGVIPYRATPQVYDPPGHVVATANQRPVGPSYPYYIGTSADFYDPGFRADDIYSYLRAHPSMRMSAFAALQTSVHDWLASQMVPKLLAALHGHEQSGKEEAAMRLLTGWNDSMDSDAPAAAIWATFWSDYISAVFGPWWRTSRVPVARSLNDLQASFDADLEAWTLTDPGNPAFSPPGGRPRTAAQVMRSAFAAAVTQLSAKLGPQPDRWAWGRLHSTAFPSLTGIPALGYGPRPAGGDQWTVNAADGYPVSSEGPSWRMIVRWTAPGQAAAEGLYPGGQSENPASPWYDDDMARWWAGSYLPMPPAGGHTGGWARWSLRPGGAG